MNSRQIRSLAYLLLAFLSFGSVAAQGSSDSLRLYQRYVQSYYDHAERQAWGEAEQDLHKAIEVLPEVSQNGLLHGLIAELRLMRADTAAALQHLREALRFLPDDVALREARASLLAAAGRPNEALLDYDHVLRLVPMREPTLYNRAIVKKAMGLYDGAIHDLEQLIRNNPKAYKPRLALAEICIVRGDEAEAEKIYNYLVETYPIIPEALRARARMYLFQGRRALALKDARTLTEHEQAASAQDYLLLGTAWTLYGEQRSARSAFDKAIERGATRDAVESAKKKPTYVGLTPKNQTP